jgi:hypothetical protein
LLYQAKSLNRTNEGIKMRKYVSAAEVAKLIRKDLKANFPEIKFSVRSDRCVRISYESNVLPANQVRNVVDKYAGETFDGMTDMRSSNGAFAIEEGVELVSLASFIFVDNNDYDFENSLRNRFVEVGA